MTSDTVTLWTHHPSTFRVDDPELRIDSKQGVFWNQNEAGYRYRQVLPKVHKQLGTTQCLWCCTIPGTFKRIFEGHDLVEWELKVPSSEVHFYNVHVWEKILYSRTDDWDRLWLNTMTSASDNVGALVSLPLKPEWINGRRQPPLPGANHVLRDD